MRFRPCQFLLILICIASSLSIVQSVVGDIFRLKSGGQVTGVIVERGKQGEYVVQADQGAVVTLSRRQVKKVVQQKKSTCSMPSGVGRCPTRSKPTARWPLGAKKTG